MRRSARSRRPRSTSPRAGAIRAARASPSTRPTRRCVACAPTARSSGAASSSSLARRWSASRSASPRPRAATGASASPTSSSASSTAGRASSVAVRSRDPAERKACGFVDDPRAADRLRFPRVARQHGEMLAFAHNSTGPATAANGSKNDEKCYPCNRSKASPIYPVAHEREGLI